MTKPIKYDYFSPELTTTSCRFFAVLLEDVFLETRNPDIDVCYRRGIYAFLKKDERNVFTKLCNDAIEKRVAYRYNRKSEERKDHGNESN